MSEDIILVGNGGCMREIAWLIEEEQRKRQFYKIRGIVDRNPQAGYKDYPCLGDDEYLLGLAEDTNVAICVGSPALRKKIACKLRQNPKLHFPVLILGGAEVASSTQIGQGSILCAHSIVTTDGSLGEFVFVNTGAIISHDAQIGNFATISPGAKLAGNVTVGEAADIGIGATVIQGITIGERAVIGAGAVVVRDIEPDVTAVGVPARVIGHSLNRL